MGDWAAAALVLPSKIPDHWIQISAGDTPMAVQSFLSYALTVPDLEAGRRFYTTFGLLPAEHGSALLPLRGARPGPGVPGRGAQEAAQPPALRHRRERPRRHPRAHAEPRHRRD